MPDVCAHCSEPNGRATFDLIVQGQRARRLCSWTCLALLAGREELSIATAHVETVSTKVGAHG